MNRNVLDLLGALRLAGRRFEAGKPIDHGALRQLIEAERENRPAVCSALSDLIQAAEDAAALGDRTAAMKHYRAAIDLWNCSL
jgi:hypothetical protein